MAEDKVRERFVVDIALEEGIELSDRQRAAIAQHISTLGHVLALEDIPGVRVLHPQSKIAYGHRHESTRRAACRMCMIYAEDEQNSNTIA